MTQNELDEKVLVLLLDLNVKQCTGPAISADFWAAPYQILTSGGLKKQGEFVPSFHNFCDENLWVAYKHQLTDWLAGRDRIIWRTHPAIEQETFTELTGDIVNREAALDGVEAPRLAHYARTRYYIFSRLTAYKA